MLNALAMIAWSLLLLASEEDHLPGNKLGCNQLEGLKGGCGEGHEDQRKVPLRKNPDPPEVLPGEGGEQSSEGHGSHLRGHCA